MRIRAPEMKFSGGVDGALQTDNAGSISPNSIVPSLLPVRTTKYN